MPDQETVERVNPVFNTAKGTLLMLSRAGVPEAEDFCRKLGFQLTQFENTPDTRTPRTMMSALMCMQEMRYRCINDLVLRAGNRNVLDIACGFSPRGLLLSGLSMNYMGCDLPAAVNELQKAIGTDHERDGYRYFGMDATNDESVRQVSESFDGPVTIITEGLLTYFIEPELRTVYHNLHGVLARHGGCWITCDLDRGYVTAAIGAIFGQDRAAELLRGTLRRRDAVADNLPQDDAAVRIGRELLREYGMTAAAVPFYRDDFDPIFGLEISGEHKAALLDAFRRLKLYVITADGSALPEPAGGHASAFTAEEADGGVTLRVTGRLDTLSSPALLEYCEKLPEATRLTVDLADTDFISSAGLRVLDMLGKRFTRLTLLHASDALLTELRAEVPQLA